MRAAHTEVSWCVEFVRTALHVQNSMPLQESMGAAHTEVSWWA